MAYVGVYLIGDELILGETSEDPHVENTEVESSGLAYELDGRSGIEGSGFYSNKTGRWWWFGDDDEEEEEADESTWTEWIVSGVVSNTLELGGQVVVGAVSGVGNYISDGLFGDDEETTTQRPTTTEGSWLLGGFISNILSSRKYLKYLRFRFNK